MFIDSTREIEAYMGAAAATVDPTFVVSGVDCGASQVAPFMEDGDLDGVSAITIGSSPAAGICRDVQSMMIHNVDTAEAEIFLRLANGGTPRGLGRFVLPVASSLVFNKKTGFRILTQSGAILRTPSAAVYRDFSSFAHVDGLGGIAANHIVGGANAAALTTVALAADTFYARPFFAPYRKSPTINQIGTWVTTGVAATNIRLGIYSTAHTNGNYLPSTLLYGSINIPTTANGSKAIAAPDLVLIPGEMYWAVLFAQSAGVSTRGSTNNHVPVGMTDGLSSTTIPNGLSGTATGITYGALPTYFPSGPALSATAQPTIYVRYSA